MFIVLLQQLILLSLCCSIHGARNADSESICQSFLVNPKTTPLDPKAKRNFTYDENSEYECEIVLQDQTLPKQIRSTIHEGLSWLAVRHVHKGLRRHRDVVRHLEVLNQISPQHHSFAYRAGYWNLEPKLSDASAAIPFLGVCVSVWSDSGVDLELTEPFAVVAIVIAESAVNGVASHAPIKYLMDDHPTQQPHSPEDHATPEDEAYYARRHLIRAYCLQERWVEAMGEVLQVGH